MVKIKLAQELDQLIFIGDRVKISIFCPYYRTFAVKRGKLVEVLGDSVGKLYQVELDSGHQVYFRRAEIEPARPEVYPVVFSGNGKKSHLSLT